MHFDLVDRVVERGTDRIVTIKQVSAAEEYLQDHFPGFPVLPGVLMLEAMVQAARLLAESDSPRTGAEPMPWVLGRVRTLRYGNFVRPGEVLRIELDRKGEGEDGSQDFGGRGVVLAPGAASPEDRVAVTGRFSLRRARVGDTTSGAYHASPVRGSV